MASGNRGSFALVTEARCVGWESTEEPKERTSDILAWMKLSQSAFVRSAMACRLSTSDEEE